MSKSKDTPSLSGIKLSDKDRNILEEALAARKTAHEFLEKEQYMDSLERIFSALKSLRDFPNYELKEFREIMALLLFDLAEVHFFLKDYKQSEKELESLFKLLDGMLKEDAERFGHLHILAMELSTRILRSRKKVMDLLVKQRINADQLYEKVNSGVVAATDKLVESLRKVGQLLASSGDYREALKFYAEAVKFSKKRTGRVSRREVKFTIEMAEIMMRVRQLRPRARRLLAAILPHAISLETIELEEEILALTEMVENQIENEPRWRQFFQKISIGLRKKRKGDESKEEKSELTEEKKPDEGEKKKAASKEKKSGKDKKSDKKK